ncbi:MAG TPA: glycosyltransferase family 87 protein, partial [Candidatus Dormibacteraeota bacterium]|nr:glycosyltransferase family 87 protein [Candidatus Dormibacteraeota bacterium]
DISLFSAPPGMIPPRLRLPTRRRPDSLPDARLSPSKIAVAILPVAAAGGLWLTWLVGEFAGGLSPSGHHDFFALYSAGALVRTGHAGSLYSAADLTALERQIYPHPTGYAGYMPFLNPPAAAALLAPLSALPFATARLLWLFVSIALAVVCALVLTNGRDVRIRLLGLAVVLLTFPAFQTFTEGQWSFLILLGCLGALAAARREREWLAGALLVVLWLKPPLLVLVLLWLVLTKKWRIAGGAVAAVFAVTLLTLPWTGGGANVSYLQYLGNVSVAHVSGGGAAGQTVWEGALPNMEGLIGLAAALAGQANAVAVDLLAGAMALVLIAVLAFAMRGWLRNPCPPLDICLGAVSLGLLLDPHLYAQDCVLLLVLVALVLRGTRQMRVRARRWVMGGSEVQLDTAVLIAGALLLDLSAIDTLWIQGLFLRPLHLLTVALIALVALPAWRRRRHAVLWREAAV